MNIIILVIIILILMYFYFKKSTNKTHVEFFDKDRTIKFFLDDEDNYVGNLTRHDIISLGSKDHQDYLQKSTKDARDFTDEEKQKLIVACQEADDFFRNELNLPYVDNNVLANMPWILSVTKGITYEEGYPHTRMNVIFITDSVVKSSMTNLVRVLIHEKVHVYERLNPHLMKKWLKYHGYKPHKRLRDYKLGRSNPDLDGWVYLDKNGKETLAIFKNENPTGIDDATYPYDRKDGYMAEAPNETLAYQIDYLYGKEKFPYQFLLN